MTTRGTTDRLSLGTHSDLTASVVFADLYVIVGNGMAENGIVASAREAQ